MAIYAFATLTVTTSVVVRPSQTHLGADAARRLWATAETNGVRYRYDGGSPTNGVGHIIQPGETMRLEGADAIREVRFIGGLGPATLTLTLEAP